MKRTTIIAIAGTDAYVLSAAEGVILNADGIVSGLRAGKVVITGTGRVTGDVTDVHKCHIVEVKNMKGEKMTSPNRAQRFVIRDIQSRSAFAQLHEIAPIVLKKQMSSNKRTVWAYGAEHDVLVNQRGTEYIEVEIPCTNIHPNEDATDHSVITGICRVNGKKVQGFVPNNRTIKAIGGKWYCKQCTTSPEIPKHSDLVREKKAKVATRKADLWPHLKGGVKETGEKVTLTITVTPDVAIKIMMLLGGK